MKPPDPACMASGLDQFFAVDEAWDSAATSLDGPLAIGREAADVGLVQARESRDAARVIAA